MSLIPKKKVKTLLLKVAESNEEKAGYLKDPEAKMQALERAGSLYAREGHHDRSAEMYTKLAGMHDKDRNDLEAGKAYQKASIQAAEHGNNADAGKYAGMAARRFERESMNKKNGLLDQSRYARQAADNYTRRVEFSEMVGQMTAGIERTANELVKKAEELEARAVKKKAKKKPATEEVNK